MAGDHAEGLRQIREFLAMAGGGEALLAGLAEVRDLRPAADARAAPGLAAGGQSEPPDGRAAAPAAPAARGAASAPPPAACAACGATAAELAPRKLLVCSRCKAARYCSVACQRAVYPAHKAACEAAPAPGR